jgi:type IV secretion system protein VirB8
MFKRTESAKIDAAVGQSINYEVSIAELAKRSERRAWMVAFISTSVSVMLAGTILYMIPLKEKVPYLVLADAYTGTSSLARLSTDVIDRRLSANEAINRSNIAHFVLARESYDLSLTNLRDWPTVLTMASPSVAMPYRQLHAQTNPNSPFNTYGRTRAIRVKILSIVLIGDDNGGTPNGATVRFQRSLYDKTSGRTTPLDSKIATIEFVYKPNLRMDDQNRVENPLGFQVMNYRVDSDYDSTAPSAVTDDTQAPPLRQSAPANAVTVAPPQDPNMPASDVQAPVGAAPYALPAETGAPAAPVQPATAPAATPVPTSAANGGRRR